MQDLRLVGVHDDGEHVVLVAADGGRYRLRVDEALRAAVRRDRARLGQLQIQMEAQLRPRDIQARIRAGETAEDVAAAGGLTLEHVRRYEGPVLAERAHVAGLARRTPHGRSSAPAASTTSSSPGSPPAPSTPRAPAGTPGARTTAPGRSSASSSPAAAAASRAGASTPAARVLSAHDDEARWLSEEEPAEPGPLPGAAAGLGDRRGPPRALRRARLRRRGRRRGPLQPRPTTCSTPWTPSAGCARRPRQPTAEPPAESPDPRAARGRPARRTRRRRTRRRRPRRTWRTARSCPPRAGGAGTSRSWWTRPGRGPARSPVERPDGRRVEPRDEPAAGARRGDPGRRTIPAHRRAGRARAARPRAGATAPPSGPADPPSGSKRAERAELGRHHVRDEEGLTQDRPRPPSTGAAARSAGRAQQGTQNSGTRRSRSESAPCCPTSRRVAGRIRAESTTARGSRITARTSPMRAATRSSTGPNHPAADRLVPQQHLRAVAEPARARSRRPPAPRRARCRAARCAARRRRGGPRRAARARRRGRPAAASGDVDHAVVRGDHQQCPAGQPPGEGGQRLVDPFELRDPGVDSTPCPCPVLSTSPQYR